MKNTDGARNMYRQVNVSVRLKCILMRAVHVEVAPAYVYVCITASTIFLWVAHWKIWKLWCYKSGDSVFACCVFDTFGWLHRRGRRSISIFCGADNCVYPLSISEGWKRSNGGRKIHFSIIDQIRPRSPTHSVWAYLHGKQQESQNCRRKTIVCLAVHYYKLLCWKCL